MRRERVPTCWYNVQSVYQIVTHDKITRNAVDIQNNEEGHQDESRDEMKNNGTFGSRQLAFMIPLASCFQILFFWRDFSTNFHFIFHLHYTTSN